MKLDWFNNSRAPHVRRTSGWHPARDGLRRRHGLGRNGRWRPRHRRLRSRHSGLPRLFWRIRQLAQPHTSHHQSKFRTITHTYTHTHEVLHGGSARGFSTIVPTGVLRDGSHAGSPQSFSRRFSTAVPRGSPRSFPRGSPRSFPRGSPPRFHRYRREARRETPRLSWRTFGKNTRANLRAEPPCEPLVQNPV
jgi:hypothetical protein